MALEWGAIFTAVSSIFKPVSDAIDNLHTSEEERLLAKAKLTATQAEVAKRWMDLEIHTIQAQQSIIAAEIQSESWLTRNWRPIIMLTFAWIIVSYTYGLVPENLNPEIMGWIVKVVGAGLGGYTIGRSAEKIAKIVKTMKKPEG